MAQLHFEVSEDLEDQIQALFIKSAREVLNEVSKQEINSKEFLSYKEAAAYVGVSFNTFKKFITDYGLKSITIGGRKMIHKPTLVQFLKEYEN